MAAEIRSLAHISDEVVTGHCTSPLPHRAATDTKPHYNPGAKPETISPSSYMVRGLILLI